MSDDASLTDFSGGDDGDDTSAADNEGSAEAADPLDEPTFTYTSTPHGAACAACGATVEKRWRAGEGGAADAPDLDPDALVCPDCKEW
ncbi:DUF7573 domain-containing protein [Halolamina litorea]|uniref:DUF7573 domain-containing protein n=1 Tax=Halolamina litorea TaxID=1515593 RepID=A0ABD6BMR8_9EURY|nr:hypothetical protein [Halolamina litorea]